MNIFDCYLVLGTHPGMGDEEHKAAHRTLSRKYHPDRPGGDSEQFIKVQEAYSALSTQKARYLLRIQCSGLGDPCPECGGLGVLKIKRKFTVLRTEPCEHCRRTGYMERPPRRSR